MTAPVPSQLAPITPDLFRLETTPAVIEGNFDEMKNLVQATIHQHKLLVTPETVQGGKNLAADFRKTSKALMSAWKSKRTESMAGILIADEQVKVMCKLLDDGADEISSQVKLIEQESKDKCLHLLEQYRKEYWFDLSVDEEYQKAEIADLVKLGSLTPKGDLTKGAKTEVETRCRLDKAWQDKISFRVAILETDCLKNDINPPLSRASIGSFLEVKDDAEFGRRLKFLIDAEITRKDEAERRMRETIEQEQAEKQRKAVAAALSAQQAEANRLAQIEAAKKMAEQENEAREREEVAKKVIESAQKQAAKPETKQPIPENTIELTIKIQYETVAEKVYTFTTKPGTDEAKIKAYFRKKAVSDGIDEKRILGMEIELVANSLLNTTKR